MTLTDRLTGRSAASADAAFDVFLDWAGERGFALYPAQEEAVLALAGGAHVVLATPTGSGKSLVAVGAHAQALAAGQRSWYTAPIKALVSEKFFALVEIFGAEQVGMLTGDAAVNPGAPIICATAEVLANHRPARPRARRHRPGRHGRVPLLRRARPRLGLAGAAAALPDRPSSC